MSSTTAAERRPWSLAARLTLWYALSAFALVFVATGYLYLALSRNLDREDDQFLADKVKSVRAILESSPLDEAALRREAEGASAQRESERIMIRVLNEAGGVRAETPGMAEAMPTGSLSRSAQRGDVSPDGKRSYRVLVDADGAYVIQAAMDRTHEAELLEDYRRHLSYILGLSLIACSVGGYLIARRGLRPVKAIAETTQHIRSTNLEERIELTGQPAEIRNLADTFNGMLDRLRDSFARMGQFAADIAHELRTPIQNLRGEIEVALGNTRTPEEYREVLGSALEECGRLARLIDSLLFLARSEDPKTQVHREQIDVGGELRSLREFYEGAAAEKNVRLELNVAAGLSADLDRALLQRAVGNLIENALAHTPPGGRVSLSAREQAGNLIMEVADTGPGIAAEHLPHLFDRFYRADRSRSQTTGGVGLGLAIVKGIAELHGGTAEVTSEPEKGTIMRLRLPMNSRRA